MANLLGGHAAPLARWIRTGLSVGHSIDQEVVVHHLLEAYGDGQTPYAAYKKLEQCHQLFCSSWRKSQGGSIS